MNGAAAVVQAVRDGDVATVRRLLSDDPRLAGATDEYRKTPLHWAAEHDHDEVARMLLDAGADLEATTSWGATPLDWAATMGSTRVADLLLARGPQGDGPGGGGEPREAGPRFASCSIRALRWRRSSGRAAPAEPRRSLGGGLRAHEGRGDLAMRSMAPAGMGTRRWRPGCWSAGRTSMPKGSSAGRACTGRRSTAIERRPRFWWRTAPIGTIRDAKFDFDPGGMGGRGRARRDSRSAPSRVTYTWPTPCPHPPE
jgi:hypothetical protein